MVTGVRFFDPTERGECSGCGKSWSSGTDRLEPRAWTERVSLWYVIGVLRMSTQTLPNTPGGQVGVCPKYTTVLILLQNGRDASKR